MSSPDSNFDSTLGKSRQRQIKTDKMVKEPLEKQAALVYNLLRKVIGHEFRFALSKIANKK